MKKKIFDYYVNAIAKEFNITKAQMFKNSKKRDCVDARQMLYYACMERPIRLSYIRNYLKEYKYDVVHSTIIHGYKQAKKLIDNDQDYKEMIEKVIEDYNDKNKSKSNVELLNNEKDENGQIKINLDL